LAEKGFKDALAEGESRSLEFRVKQADGLVHTRWSWLYSSESKELFAVVHNIEQEKVVENLRQDFVDMVSHDLRSPLSSMHVALDLVGQKAYGEISKEAEQEVAGARKNLIRLLDFVNDLLDFQKLKHGTLQLECDNAHVDGLVQSAVDFVKPALQAKEIEIETEGEDILLFADPKKMVQLLTNLLANAIQYTPKNGNISIAWTRHSDFTEISVSDTGPGIAEKFRKRIFEAFEQTPESVSQGEGTGLGLAICKLICDAHNGSIFVESELGKGSKFIVRIPSPKG
jgi:signal transduction histidine kinase